MGYKKIKMKKNKGICLVCKKKFNKNSNSQKICSKKCRLKRRREIYYPNYINSPKAKEKTKKYHQKYYDKNKETILNYQKQYAQKNKEKIKEYKKKYLKEKQKDKKGLCKNCGNTKNYHAKGLCYVCYHKQYTKKYYQKNKKEINKKAVIRVGEWRKKNPTKTKKQRLDYQKRAKKRYPEKIKSRLYANNNKQKGERCEKCGSKEKLEFHHTHYEKNEGITLCKKCHIKEHKRGDMCGI